MPKKGKIRAQRKLRNQYVDHREQFIETLPDMFTVSIAKNNI